MQDEGLVCALHEGVSQHINAKVYAWDGIMIGTLTWVFFATVIAAVFTVLWAESLWIGAVLVIADLVIEYRGFRCG